jgi:hypothetical protein
MLNMNSGLMDASNRGMQPAEHPFGCGFDIVCTVGDEYEGTIPSHTLESLVHDNAQVKPSGTDLLWNAPTEGACTHGQEVYDMRAAQLLNGPRPAAVCPLTSTTPPLLVQLGLHGALNETDETRHNKNNNQQPTTNNNNNQQQQQQQQQKQNQQQQQ